MTNMSVGYVRPNYALQQLASELRARFGNPARTYEYVTGYKSPSNISGHNADNNGVVHSMDIFVGPGNLTEAQGIDLAERLRLEGKKGVIPGYPDRLAYIIHRGRIAGDHTDWEWVAYNGIDNHYDHIHVSSVFDYYWGDPVVGSFLDYDNKAVWNLWGTPAAPATKGLFVTLTAAQEKEVHQGALKALRYLDTKSSDVAKHVWATPVLRGGAKISALQELADAKTLGQQVKAEVAKQVSGIDYEKLANLVIGKLVNEVGIKITGVGK